VEQLRTYAEIINIPIEVAYNKEEYVKALRRFADMDLVFVDTAGRSQQNLVQLSELREFVQIRKPDEVHRNRHIEAEASPKTGRGAFLAELWHTVLKVLLR
jgi:flagellar biosynthesis GTPase FlhF